ncbi:hypothetical protein WKK05_40545 (plasmid) [Nostoc sp. UHCC 0302]|uniref:hypothetical protein n=1 Tax=Nostoc sp. UHCC 0302 TaxID=3134896 RepID=UPI00311CBFD4
MKSLINFIIKQKILLTILGVGVAILGFQMWKVQDEKYQSFLTEQQEVCEKSIAEGLNVIKASKTLSSMYKSQLAGEEINYKEIRQPGINVALRDNGDYVLIRTNNRPLIPNNTPHYKNDYFKSYSQPSKDKTNYVELVTVHPLNNKEALVESRCSPSSFATPLTDLYEISQPNDFTYTNPRF